MPLVLAQWTRRLLDRRIGYGTTPLLWRAFGSGVSSGRCLVPAAKLVIEWDERVKEDGMVSSVIGDAVLSREYNGKK